MEDTLQESKRLFLRVRDGMEMLKQQLKMSSTSDTDSVELCLSMKNDVSQIQSLCRENDGLAMEIRSKNSRNDRWIRNVEELYVVTYLLQDFLDRYLVEQRRAKERAEYIARAQRKSLDILNRMGVRLCNTVLKLIEWQHRGDKWIIYIGMALSPPLLSLSTVFV